MPRLLVAEQVAGSPDLEVAHRDPEARPELGVVGKGRQAGSRLRGERLGGRIEQIGERPLTAPAHSPADLVRLRQIRGRVGRSSERAFAYLLYPSAETLTPEAAARLATLSDNTELGSGFRVAMRDLEIRGAGNLLGDEQSGHVAAVGFELYCQMLEDAAEQMRAGAEGLEAADEREPI